MQAVAAPHLKAQTSRLTIMPDLRLFLPKTVPMVLIAVAILGVTASWVPLAVIAKYTQVKHEKPRIHLFQDMDNQPKLKAQAASPIFTDGRAARQPVAGTVARGELRERDDLYLGYTVKTESGKPAADFLAGFPEGTEVDSFYLAHGKKKFDTFCYTCHGVDGYGHGPTNERALALAIGDDKLSYGTGWVQSANFHEVNEEGKLRFGADIYPNGQLFNVITNGKSTMAGYGHAIPAEDRWAIVAYVRALQLSQNQGAAKVAMDNASLKNPNLQTAELLGESPE